MCTPIKETQTPQHICYRILYFRLRHKGDAALKPLFLFCALPEMWKFSGAISDMSYRSNNTIVSPTSQLYAKRDVKIGVQNTLVCCVTDFHPPPVNISWTRKCDVSDLDISETQYYSNPDFSFRIFSYLNFSPEQGGVYTCTVRHRGLEQGIIRFWVLVVGIIVGFLGLMAGIIVIVMSKMQLSAV
ncbi:putative h-2 class II histocompatibility antigen [Triplophysa rosa]|uniref:H-2 class II histocompatibility antigen n=1 Tax=Triplophysa rosa TaxID=992332 RepID=A0A9W7WPU9_TRIRA|nr:putative h-2 class II histocompatibility antigen [Triplophysa rosa]